jgi:hypothetical protein
MYQIADHGKALGKGTNSNAHNRLSPRVKPRLRPHVSFRHTGTGKGKKFSHVRPYSSKISTSLAISSIQFERPLALGIGEADRVIPLSYPQFVIRDNVAASDSLR